MLEYVLSATLLWSDARGQIKSERINGVYASQQDCLDELTDSIAVIRRVFGSVATPTGTMCEPREKVSLSPEQIEQIRAAKELAKLKNDNDSFLFSLAKREAEAAGDSARVAELESSLAKLQELNARELQRRIESIERTPRSTSGRHVTPASRAAARAVERAAKDAAAAVAGAADSAQKASE